MIIKFPFKIYARDSPGVVVVVILNKKIKRAIIINYYFYLTWI